MADNNVYYLWGEEVYLIDKKIAEIIDEVWKAGGEEPEVVYVDAEEISALDLGQTLEFSPLFTLARVVIIKRPGWLGKSYRKLRKIEETLQVLQDYLQNDNHGQVLIITSAENNASNPITKLLVKNARVINVKTLSPKELEAWCKSALQQQNVRVAPAALNRMVGSGRDMYYLQNLIDKLSLISSPAGIGVAEMEEHLDSKQEIKVFKLTDALLNRNLKGAMAAFYQLQEQGQHHLLLLHMIIRQFVMMSKIKFYKEAGYNTSKIAELMGQKDFIIKKMAEQAANFSKVEIRRIFTRLLEIDTSLKSESKNPQMLMETLLVELCG
jgi:DNA polymerase III, delta subunit